MTLSLIKSLHIMTVALLCCSSLSGALTLEPIASFTSTIPGSPLLSDGYGQMVRINGDWVFVAAPLARADNKVISGAIYVYKKSCSGYKQIQIITTEGTSDHLGALQIESKGDWLLVSLIGTPSGPINGDTFQDQDFTGSVQFYHLEDGQWIWHSSIDRNTPGLEELSVIDPNALDPTVPPSFFEQGANLGLNFSIDWCHRVLLIAAQYQAVTIPSKTAKTKQQQNANELINSGAVYAFDFNDSSKKWVLKQKITNPDGVSANDVFGANVVTDGKLALISNGPIFQLPKSSNSFVYVYKRCSDNTWKYVQKVHGDQTSLTPTIVVVPPNPPAVIPFGDAFGNALVLKDGHAIIGAPLDNLGSQNIHGAAYFYRVKDKKLKRVFKATSSDPNSQGFGFPTIRLYKGCAYISDPLYSGDDGAAQGAIAVYCFKQGNWKSKGLLLDPSAQAFNFFGESFDIRHNIICVGQGLPASGLFFSATGTPPIATPLPYSSKPFTIYKIK